MQGIYNYIHETNRVSRIYNVAAELYYNLCNMKCYFDREICFVPLQCTFRSMCAVPNTAVFCNSLISCFPDILLRYGLSDFGKVPDAPIIICITFAFTFHMR
jgi:hypothetical protein